MVRAVENGQGREEEEKKRKEKEKKRKIKQRKEKKRKGQEKRCNSPVCVLRVALCLFHGYTNSNHYYMYHQRSI